MNDIVIHSGKSLGNIRPTDSTLRIQASIAAMNAMLTHERLEPAIVAGLAVQYADALMTELAIPQG